MGSFRAIYGWFCNIWRPPSDDDFIIDLTQGEKFHFSVYLTTYFVVILSKTYTSLVSTSSLSIYNRTVTKKHWSLSKIVFRTSRKTFRHILSSSNLQCSLRGDPRNLCENARFRLLATHPITCISVAKNCLRNASL